MKYLVTIVIISLFTELMHSQVQTFKGEDYITINGTYEMLQSATATYHPIIEGSITIKFANNLPTTTITNIEQQYNLIPFRQAITGWYDYKINGNVDVIQLASTLLTINNIEDVIIPKYGKYLQTPK